MRFLRTVSTQRLLAILAGVVIAAAGGTAIAVAASSGGRVPPRESLAKALHQAATARTPVGITARIKFTNGLISASDLQGSDPILNGSPNGRLWLSTSDHRLRLELQGENGDAQLVVNNGSFSVYDPMSNTVYKGKLPADNSAQKDKKSSTDSLPSVAQIQADLNQLMQHVNLLGPLPRNVAGQPAYKVVLSPKHDGGLLGDVQLAWDAAHGVPLGVAIYSTQSSSPVLELKATSISYGPVSSSDLKIKAPAGAKVVQVSPTAAAANDAHGKGPHGKGGAERGKKGKHHAAVTGPAAVQAHLPFKLAAPAKLAGLPRQAVQLLDWGGSPAALATYGQGLGGIAVIEQTAPSQTTVQGGDRQGLSLPTVSINGATGQELATSLGTVLRFSTGGVAYTVLGSVPPIAAETAAKQLAP